MKKLFHFLIFLFPIVSYSQIQTKGIPYFFEKKAQISKNETFILEKFDKEFLLLNDKKNARLKQYAFAKDFDVDLSFNTIPEVQTDSFDIFYKKIIVPDAYGTAVTFNDYHLMNGEKIFIFDNSQKYLIGALTSKNNKKSGILPVRFIPKDTIIIEYQRLKTNKNSKTFIKNVAGAYRPLQDTSEWCEVNINCDTNKKWQKIKHAIVKIIFSENGSKYACTGNLIANTRQDNTPYLITANHCINTQSEAESAVFYFNYEASDCSGTTGDDTQTLAGSNLIATADYHLDFSLLRLTVVPPQAYQPYYAGWDRVQDYKDSSVCIHHPAGDIKKISKDYDAPGIASFSGYDSRKHWEIKEWDQGTTEGGSSGSGLFTTEGLLIGTLSGGEASCDDNVNDDFQQFYHCWDDYLNHKMQLRYWLDPFLFDPPKMYGYYPYENDSLPKPQNFSVSLSDSVVKISFDDANPPADKYYIYKNLYILDSVVSGGIYYDTVNTTGVYLYYATAVYSAKESKPSEMKTVVLGDTSRIPKVTRVKVFPNPANQDLAIQTPDSIPITNVKLYDIKGRIIKDIDFRRLNYVKINVSDLKKSIYILVIYTTGDIYRKKIVILK